MTITVFEDHHYVRVIGSKKGAIYYLITINKLESFDLPTETVSGINEMISMLKNSYNEKVHHLYTIGADEISLTDLKKNDIHAEAFDGIGQCKPADLDLLGTACTTGYNFIPKTYTRLRQLATCARYSIAASAMMILISVLLFGLGIQNSHTSTLYENKVREAHKIYTQNLKALERDYTLLCQELDFTNINEIIGTYNDSESEPKLYTILGSITGNVRENTSLTKVEVTRSGIEVNTSERIVRDDTRPRYSTHASSLFVKIDGIIESPYPLSKKTFSTFLSDIQESFTVNNAAFQHTQESASFSVECETKR